MKKIYRAISVATLGSLFCFGSANAGEAVTKGHYAGLNMIDSRLTFVEYAERTTNNRVFARAKANDLGFGLNYKYAMNHKGFFVAPGVFFEKPNASADRSGTTSVVSDGSSGHLARLTVRSRYGFSTDFGYDVTERIAPYLTLGYSRIDYATSNFNTPSGIPTSKIRESFTTDWFYGFGVKTKINDQFSVVAEYNRQNFRAKTFSSATTYYNGVYRATLETFKLGASYNF